MPIPAELGGEGVAGQHAAPAQDMVPDGPDPGRPSGAVCGGEALTGRRAGLRAVIVPATDRDQGTILDGDGTIRGTTGTIFAAAMFQHPGQHLDRQQKRERRPARDHLPTGPAPAAATFAARLAVVPAASAAHGSQPDRCPERRSASSTSEATISMPSTDSGNACACPPSPRARRPAPAYGCS